jgi:phage baseplate assembly protein W
MAHKTLVINPVKYSEEKTIRQSQIYKGFSSVDSNSRDVRLYDFELIKQDLINQFSVRKNERLMYPSFGTVIWDSIFDPFTDDIKTTIADDVARIVRDDPRVNATTIDITEKDFGIILELTLEYVGTNQTDVLTLNFDKNLGLTTQ